MSVPSPSRLPVAVLLSGTGRTLQNLLQSIHRNNLSIDVRLVISSHADVRGIDVAREHGIGTQVFLPKDYGSTDDYSDAVFEACRGSRVELVVMAGFIRYVKIPDDFQLRVINIHPSLIPAFCGKGFYGSRVHQAAIEYGVKLSGCTVHFVDNEYDHGPIIAQRAVPVEPDDSADTLAARVFQAECQLYPAVIQAIAEGRVTVTGRCVRVTPPLTE